MARKSHTVGLTSKRCRNPTLLDEARSVVSRCRFSVAKRRRGNSVKQRSIVPKASFFEENFGKEFERRFGVASVDISIWVNNKSL